MGISKTIVCFANSRKFQGFCVAGREWKNGKAGAWIRPISARQGGEISIKDQAFKNGSVPKPLDVIAIEFLSAKPSGFQSENYVIDDTYYWKKVGSLSWDEAQAAIDKVALGLWANTSSSKFGTFDRVPEALATQSGGSLRLIEVSDLTITVGVEHFGKRKVRGEFSYGKSAYALAITDPKQEAAYLAKPDGSYLVGGALLCVSLGELYGGHAYKLIAGVLPKK